MTSSHNNALNESHDYDYLDPDVFKHTIESSCTYSSDFIQHPTENKNNAFQSEINDITEDLSLDLSGATTCTQSGVSKKESKVHFEDSISSKKSRKYKEETLFLNKYLSKNKSRVKKEYLRVFFIRGIKKIWRHIREIPKNKIKIRFLDINSPDVLDCYRKLMLIYQNNEFKCKEISKTQSGPGTDGKSKRPKSQQAKRKSFNNAFCSEFFSSKIVQQAFIIIIDAIFADRDISVLCYKFNIFCCDLHREQWKASRKNIIIRVIEALECQQKWADLKEFLTNKFISGMKSKPSKKKDFIDDNEEELESYFADSQ